MGGEREEEENAATTTSMYLETSSNASTDNENINETLKWTKLTRYGMAPKRLLGSAGEVISICLSYII